jgi:hypothetical protein
MTKESCRQIILGGNLGATRSSTTVLDIRPQTVDPLPIMPLESSWIGTFPRCSMLEPRPAARMSEKYARGACAPRPHPSPSEGATSASDSSWDGA